MPAPEPTLLDRVVATGLPGAPPIAPAAPDGDTWTALLEAVARARVAGHLSRAITTGSLPATQSQHDDASLVLEDAFALDLALEAALLETVDVCADAGVDVRVLKGLALARLSYSDVADRSFGDVDVLVRSRDYDNAIAALERAGHRRRYAEPRPGFDRRFGKGVCMVRQDGLEVDVHRTFVAGSFGLAIDLDDLWADADEFSIGDRRLLALGRDCRFLHACYHVALGDPEPRRPALRDVAQMLAFEPPDAERVLDLAARWRGTAVVASALSAACTLLSWTPSHPLVEMLADYQPAMSERRALAAYAAGSSYAARAASGLRAIRDPRERFAYAWSLLVPNRSYLAARDGGYFRRAKRGIDANRSASPQ